MRHRFVLICSLLLLLKTASAQQPLFQLLPGKDTHIRFSNDINESENLNVLAYEYFYNGGGVAVGDINNDGLEDLFFTSNMGPDKLYLNLGNMKFKDITREANKELEGREGGWKTGVTMADVNGDGLLDIYICYSGKVSTDLRRNQLFINQGNLKFAEKSKEYGLDDPSYSTQAVFFDMDNDGDLDMFLLNHSVKKIDNIELARYHNEVDSLSGNKLYENRGNHFVDVSAKAGIHQNPLTFGLGIAVADINKDGWQDVYVTNDYNEPDYLYINHRDGTFSEISKQAFRHMSQFSMGVEIADLNNDALPDIITLDMLPEDNKRQKQLQLQENYESFQLMISQDLQKQYMRNMLQLNNGDGTFSEIGQLAGISNTDWSWCPMLCDLDNDGYKDLFITNGYLRDYTNKDFLRYWGDYKIKKAIDREPAKLMDLVTAMPSTALYNYAFKNNGNLTFSNKKTDWGITDPGVSSGAVYADLDNDGDLDLVVNRINKEAAVYKNMSRENNQSAYIAIKLKYTGANSFAIGSKVYVYAGGKVQYEEVNPGRGYLSCVSTKLHFGLGNTTSIDSINIIWPNSTKQQLLQVPVNQQLEITYKSEAKPVQQILENELNSYFDQQPAVIDYRNEPFEENDFKRQLLMLFMYSKTGPVVATADVNKDGLADLFISGDKSKPGRIYIQQKAGSFKPDDRFTIGDEASSAIAAAIFFDANGDGWPDLYIAKGGYSLFAPNTPALQDELYLSDGTGNFSLAKDALPDMSASSKSVVRACDYDGDGDVDLFVGGRIIPGSYPLAPKSYLLNNDGKGHFSIVHTAFDSAGMVTDAQWVDINNDGKKDLILVGEMMAPSIYINSNGSFTDKTNDYFDKPLPGCWFSLAVADVDGDGKDDIIAGNIGQNTQMHFTQQQPGELYYADFDKNGSIDPFFNFYIQGTSYPFVSRDELNEQMYTMRKKFTSYKDYANATMKEIVGTEELSKAGKLTATECRTVCLLNRNGKFVVAELPVQAQYSAVTKIMTGDFNKDGKTDLLLLGNHSDNRLKIGSIDANYGCMLAGDGKGNFTYIDQVKSGLSVMGDVKSATIIDIKGSKYLVIGISGEAMQFYKMQ